MASTWQTGAVTACVAMDTAGTVYSSRPVGEDGTFAYYVYGGDNAYDAEVTQEDGSTKTQKIDEVADVLRLTTGALPPGKGIRLNGEKFMVLRPLDKATYQAKVTNYEGEEESHPVTLDAVHMLKKGTIGCIIVEKGGYIFLAFCDNSKPEQQPPAAASALAIGIYWAVGPDAKDE